MRDSKTLLRIAAQQPTFMVLPSVLTRRCCGRCASSPEEPKLPLPCGCCIAKPCPGGDCPCTRGVRCVAELPRKLHASTAFCHNI